MTVIVKNDEATPLGKDDVDGVRAFMDELDEPTSTTWDQSCENRRTRTAKGNASPGTGEEEVDLAIPMSTSSR